MSLILVLGSKAISQTQVLSKFHERGSNELKFDKFKNKIKKIFIHYNLKIYQMISRFLNNFIDKT